MKKNLEDAGIKNVRWERGKMQTDAGRLDITVGGKMIYTRYYKEPGKLPVSIGYDEYKENETLDPDFISKLISEEINRG